MSTFENTPFSSTEEEIEHLLKVKDGIEHQRQVLADKALKNLERLKKLGWKQTLRSFTADLILAQQRAQLAAYDARTSAYNNALAAAQANQDAAERARNINQLSGTCNGNVLGGMWSGVFGK